MQSMSIRWLAALAGIAMLGLAGPSQAAPRCGGPGHVRCDGGFYCQTAAGCTAPILNVAKDTASITLMYSTTVGGDYKVSARVSDSFTGTATDVAYYYGYQLPSYSIANARLTLAHSNWQAHLFVDNLTNKQALMTANNTSFQFNIPQLVRYSTNQPRTYGTTIDYKF